MKRNLKLGLTISSVILIIGLIAVLYLYNRYNKSELVLEKEFVFYVPDGADYSYVKKKLYEEKIVEDTVLFDFIANVKSFTANVKSGKYILTNGMKLDALVNLLRSGNQTPVKLTFNNIRFLDQFASKISEKLEMDSIEIMNLLNNESFIKSIGFNNNNIMSLFLPNTYEIWWNISPEDFVIRMKKEYDKFWNDDRISKANSIGLSPLEVSVLASIVQEETNKVDEMSTIAGVYINRLNSGMKLEADPTARFAFGDFSVKRILFDYLKIESPYNTYHVKGLPPGPICMPNPITIDKVLDYESHDYYFFCAKADSSGRHVFASKYSQHSRNARAYHRYLNSLKK